MKKSLSPPATAAIAMLASAAIPSVTANNFPYAMPTFRYEPFEKLDSTSRNIAETKLGYLGVTWNNHGLAPIEKKGWSALSSNERDAAVTLGFTEGTWDCFINHYEQYSWEDLEARGVQQHYRDLGWSEGHWTHEIEGVPYTEARWWDQLTSVEKQAANNLCYFEPNWDKLDMNPNPSFFPHPMPNFRYEPWDELSIVTRTLATNMMNYTEDTWNNLGNSVVEKNTFLNLQPDQREGAMEIGFYTHTWDCFMNHYLSYYWSSFHEDLRVAIETLGWDEDMWSDTSGAAPPSEDKIWDDLTPEERAAATRLCYFKEIWDEEPITQWYNYETGKNTAVTADGPVPQDIDLGIFEETGYVGKAPGSVGAEAYTAADLSASYKATSSALVLIISTMAFLFV